MKLIKMKNFNSNDVGLPPLKSFIIKTDDACQYIQCYQKYRWTLVSHCFPLKKYTLLKLLWLRVFAYCIVAQSYGLISTVNIFHTLDPQRLQWT